MPKILCQSRLGSPTAPLRGLLVAFCRGGLLVPVAVFLLSAAAVQLIFCSKSAPPMFEAQARVWVPNRVGPPVVSDAPVSQLGGSSTKTIAEVLKSYAVCVEASRLLKRQGMERCPEPEAIVNCLRIFSSQDSDVMTVAYDCSDGNVAIKVLRAVLQGLTEFDGLQSVGVGSVEIELEKRVQQCRQTYAGVRAEIEVFRHKQGTLICLHSQIHFLMRSQTLSVSSWTLTAPSLRSRAKSASLRVSSVLERNG